MHSIFSGLCVCEAANLDAVDANLALDACGGHDFRLRLTIDLSRNEKLLLLLFEAVQSLFTVKLPLLFCAL